MFCLPPHTTNILQPLDVVSYPVKAYFSKLSCLVNLATIEQRNPVTVSKGNFTTIFKEACENKLSVFLIKTGFRKCVYCTDQSRRN